MKPYIKYVPINLELLVRCLLGGNGGGDETTKTFELIWNPLEWIREKETNCIKMWHRVR